MRSRNWLSFFAAAQPLGAYEAGATTNYGKVSDTLLKAWAAATVGGLILCVPGDLIQGNSFSPFYIVGCLGKFVGTGACLGAVRGYQVYEKTGELPELSFDLDSALEGGAQKMDSRDGPPPPAP